MIKNLHRRALRKLGSWTARGGPRSQRLYYRFLSEAFRREEAAVGVGIQTYRNAAGSDQHVYLLRRNIHMIEKGLTMQPRRSTFALEYIEDTVSALDRTLKTPGSLDPGERQWMLSVLAEYFDATSSTSNALIISLRTVFKSLLENHLGVALTSGPHVQSISEQVVSPDALLRLTQRRRSVRWFDGRVVPRDKISMAIDVAIESPTACNRQPYRFEVFDDPISVQKVAEIPMGTKGYAHQIPGIIAVIGDLSAFFDERDRHLIYIDGSLATMGLVLGLEAQGIASCCINWPDMPDREEAMRRLLGLGAHERIVMLLAYGYADPAGLVPYSAKADGMSLHQFRELVVDPT